MIQQPGKSSQTIKLLYEDIIKTLLRIYPLTSLEIIVGNYLIEKAKIDDMSKEEEDMSLEFNINQQQLKEALRKLEKLRIVECFDLKIKKVQDINDKTRRKYYTFWKINNSLLRDTEIILCFMEKELDQHYKKNKTKVFYVCQNTNCEQKYSLDEAFMLNNRCRKIECQARLEHKLLSQDELQQLSNEQQQSKDIFTKIRNLILKIGNSSWPFEQNLEQYVQNLIQEINPMMHGQFMNQNIQINQNINQKTLKQKDQEINQKLRYLKQIFQYDVNKQYRLI